MLEKVVLVLEIGDVGIKFEKMLTWRETTYFSGNLSSGVALQCMSLWPILPYEQQ